MSVKAVVPAAVVAVKAVEIECKHVGSVIGPDGVKSDFRKCGAKTERVVDGVVVSRMFKMASEPVLVASGGHRVGIGEAVDVPSGTSPLPP